MCGTMNCLRCKKFFGRLYSGGYNEDGILECHCKELDKLEALGYELN